LTSNGRVSLKTTIFQIYSRNAGKLRNFVEAYGAKCVHTGQ
jgi:hypothetical protein